MIYESSVNISNLSQRPRSLTDMAAEVLRSIGLGYITDEAFLAIVVLIHSLSDQVEAVQLMEYLNACPITPFPCYRVLDL